MSAELERKTPAYASYRSFQNYLEHLRKHPLPSRIDKSVMSHLNYGTRTSLLGTLRYLDLITQDDTPTTRLEQLVQAEERDRAPILAKMVKDAYPYLWDGSIDLKRATSAEFDEKVKAVSGANGSTLEKAATFFLALAAEAGEELSPHLTKRKTGLVSGSRRARGRPRKTQEAKQPSILPPPSPGPESAPTDITEKLLDKFPEFDPHWDDSIKAKWFEGFEKLMSSAEKNRKKDGDPHA